MKSTSTVRAAVASAAAPKVPRSRPLPTRKALLAREQLHLLTSNDLVLFLRPGDFAADEWRALRTSLAAIPPPPPAANGTASPSSSTSPADDVDALRLTLLRPGLLPAILRSSESGVSPSAASLDATHLGSDSHLKGPLAVLTAPTLHPPTLSAVLTLLTKFSRTPPANAPPPAPDAPPVERLAVLSSLVERQAADPERTKKVGELPPLEVLRAQIVGLLSAPGSRITGVLGARAREVGRTLEGFKAGLEEAAKPKEEASA
ncbi:hypothetical protein JCM10213_000579 [Rhodosporidiobolus nylandii]